MSNFREMAKNTPPPVYVHAEDRKQWRAWLAAHHRTAESAWLCLHRKSNPAPSVSYEESVLEALCFGWIDSKPQKRDALSYWLFFSRRKPRSVWSASNKKRVELLMREGLMAEAGLQSIAVARANGSWASIDDAEALVMPLALAEAFRNQLEARANFDAFPPSVRRGIYTWISTAKTDLTRARRIAETVEKAALNIPANQWTPKK